MSDDQKRVFIDPALGGDKERAMSNDERLLQELLTAFKKAGGADPVEGEHWHLHTLGDGHTLHPAWKCKFPMNLAIVQQAGFSQEEYELSGRTFVWHEGQWSKEPTQ